MCEIKRNLKMDLKIYGLNPSDWTLEKMKKQKFKVTNVTDNNFYFIGKTQKSGLHRQWSTLQLISI